MSGGTARAITKARWENVFRMYEQGKTLDEIGAWIGRSTSTARQLLKRSALERCKAPDWQWPMQDGKRVCDVPHPMPLGEKAQNWAHPRGYPMAGWKGRVAYCPVCRRQYVLSRRLYEVFLAEHSS